MKIERICEFCSKRFYTIPSNIARGNGRFCSKACGYANRHKNNVEKVCEWCGKKLIVMPSRIARGDGHFCSHKCQATKCKEDHQVILNCQRCNIEFKMTAGEVDRGRGIFCSKSCARGNPKVDKICKKCKKPFQVHASQPKHGQGIYCSNECRYEDKIGPDSPAWRGGISNEDYCWKFNERTKEIIRNRFNRRCYFCNKSEIDNGQKLSVHHCDYNKSAGCKGMMWSLLPLCFTDHCRTNHNRWYWFCLLRDYWIYEYPGFELWINI